jgi:hypothetical protein
MAVVSRDDHSKQGHDAERRDDHSKQGMMSRAMLSLIGIAAVLALPRGHRAHRERASIPHSQHIGPPDDVPVPPSHGDAPDPAVAALGVNTATSFNDSALAPVRDDPTADDGRDDAQPGDVVPDTDNGHHPGTLRLLDESHHHVEASSRFFGATVIDLRPRSVRAQTVRTASQGALPPRLYSTPLVIGPMVRASVCALEPAPREHHRRTLSSYQRPARHT